MLHPIIQTFGTDDLNSLFQTRFEEGYDVYDSEYVSWLHHNHPESVPPQFKNTATAAVSSSSGATCNNSSDTSVSASKYILNYSV